MSNDNDVLIIGGGIIGVSAAYFLTQQGIEVTLIEKGDICSGSSYGNAGLIPPTHSSPLPGPGMLTQGFKWMLNPESPFYIKPRLDPDLIRWLWHFQMHSNRKDLHRAIPLLRDMQRASLHLFRDLIELEELDCHFEQVGGLTLFKTERSFAQGRDKVEEMQVFGLDMELLDGDAVRELEPIVRPDIVGGIYSQEDAHLDPALFVKGLAEAAKVNGATLLTNTEVLGFETVGARVKTVDTTQGTFHPKDVVLATGAWSTSIAQQLGIKFLMQPAKGYSITMEEPAKMPKRYLFLGETKVAVTPIGSELRFAGTLELTGLDLSINQRRINAILQAGERYLSGVASSNTPEIWSGLRPCPPDGLPYIGRSRVINNLIVATGHAMLGISMGPVTGKLVAQLIQEEEPELDLSAFAVDRFAR
ncbi:MAG: FAD-dependent oxidoreductase [Anaerolineae bacterium]|jgi:D-amino-acid dehydrogenase|nr:FAD-dependent oxidoreductase [Anaerolineae bacterium]MBT7189956.1 FAD-dependent oxidoreductase [Anaerolineae bacterium]MBT7602005.1 FAD-dependent oxidoreductase [Anaerolineae bacterium]MBT7988406.1 FAD-dependent oxidoreductase [Anaerolineae bacterium]